MSASAHTCNSSTHRYRLMYPQFCSGWDHCGGLSVCLCRGESVRTAFMLAQGGEFAFVLLSLAAELKVLPEELNKLLIIVVVISMALTPGLASIGKKLADKYDEENDQSGKPACLHGLCSCTQGAVNCQWAQDGFLMRLSVRHASSWIGSRKVLRMQFLVESK